MRRVACGRLGQKVTSQPRLQTRTHGQMGSRSSEQQSHSLMQSVHGGGGEKERESPSCTHIFQLRRWHLQTKRGEVSERIALNLKTAKLGKNYWRRSHAVTKLCGLWRACVQASPRGHGKYRTIETRLRHAQREKREQAVRLF